MSNPDLSEFDALVTRRGPSCTIAAVLDSLKPSEREKLDAALATPKSRIPHTVIDKWIRNHGLDVPVGAGAVARHRNGECACHR